MKNYYKILQVDKDASPEIIKVAYKLLVKKYHPDLKEGEEKKLAEEKIKEINEAYDVLSDPTNKNEYDQTLINDNISQEQYKFILNENMNLKKELNYLKNNYTNYYNSANDNKTNYTNMYDGSNNMNNTRNTNPLYNLFNNFSEEIKTLIAFGITILILFIFIQIPFLKSFLFNILDDGYIFIISVIIIFYIYFFRNKK